MIDDIYNFIQPIKYNFLIAIIIFASSFVFANLTAFIINKYLSKKSLLKQKFFSARFIRIILPFIGLLVSVKYIRLSLKAKQIFSYEPSFVIIENIIFVCAVGFAGIIFFKAIVFLFHKWVKKSSSDKDIDANFSSLLSKILKLVIFIIALIIVLDRFGVNINSFIVSLGIGSLAVALAAQETLANIIAGIVLLIDRPFIIGDVIKTNSGAIGTVQLIGIRSCRIITLDGKLLILPNTELTKSSVTNLSYNEANYKIRFSFNVPYQIKLEDLQKNLSEKFSKTEKILKDPPPAFIFSKFNPQNYEIILLCYCRNEDKGTLTENLAREKVLETLVEFGMPKYTVPN
ncbi:MAG: mechanosensitive ion channel family protein [Bacteroidetes bacterium]|nr:mechanosensitive ion channel family protein [Bacteroidota bacterium]